MKEYRLEGFPAIPGMWKSVLHRFWKKMARNGFSQTFARNVWELGYHFLVEQIESQVPRHQLREICEAKFAIALDNRPIYLYYLFGDNPMLLQFWCKINNL